MLFKHNRKVNVSTAKMAEVRLEAEAEYFGETDMQQQAMMFTLNKY